MKGFSIEGARANHAGASSVNVVWVLLPNVDELEFERFSQESWEDARERRGEGESNPIRVWMFEAPSGDWISERLNGWVRACEAEKKKLEACTEAASATEP